MDTLYTSGDLLQTLTPRPRVVQKPPSSSNASFNSFHPSPTLEASALPTQKISTSTPISRPNHLIASSILHWTLQPFIACHDCVQRIVNTSCNTLGRSIARARWYSTLKSTRTRSGRVVALPANTTITLPTYEPVSLGRESMQATMLQMLGDGPPPNFQKAMNTPPTERQRW